jgi:hypothetical protein
MTIETIVSHVVAFASGVGFVAIGVFVRAWRQGWRDYRSAEASAQMTDSDWL